MADKEFSEYELSVIRDKWFLGLTDRQIGDLINRSDKSIQSKRQDLHLTPTFHPERARTKVIRNTGRNYTAEDDRDIMYRFNNGEEPRTIALTYKVTTRAINCKIDRLLCRDDLGTMSERQCLRCRKWFFSYQPKSTNRRCSICQSSLNENGASFLTVY